MKAMNAINLPKIGNNWLKLDGTVFKTSGNIVFPDDKEAGFHTGKSEALKNMDQYIQKGILNNAMADLISKFKPEQGK